MRHNDHVGSLAIMEYLGMSVDNLEPSFALEGGEGSGKSTITKILHEMWLDFDVDIKVTREPGGVDIAEKIRHIILDKTHTNLAYEAEALLYAAARNQHLIEKVFPLIAEGNMILMDRFVDSSIAYQGGGRGLGIDEVLNINRFATRGYFPDKTFFIDVPPQIGMDRISKNKDREINRLDLEKMSFHETLYNTYKWMARKYSTRIVTIDGLRSPEIIARDIFVEMWKIRNEKYNKVYRP